MGHFGLVGLLGSVGLVGLLGPMGLMSVLDFVGMAGLVCQLWLYLGIFWISCLVQKYFFIRSMGFDDPENLMTPKSLMVYK